MTYEYKSRSKWSDEEDIHGKIDMDCGFSCDFSKPVEFGGKSGMLNPEDAFTASLAMCFSITFKSMVEKMRLEIDNFTLDTKGILEDTDDGSEITKIYLYPQIESKEDEERIERALDLAKDNCLISSSMKSEVIIEPDISG